MAFKFPTGKQIMGWITKNGIILAAGIGIGILGSWYYQQVIPRSALVEVTSRAAELDAIVTLTPENKVLLAFIIGGLLIATLVSEIKTGRR